MLTPPAGVFKKIYPPQGGVILQETTPTDWSNFCNANDANALAAELNTQFAGVLSFPSPAYVDYEETLGYLVMNPSGPRMYTLVGTYLVDGSPYWISPVGSFLDRKVNPNPFLDRNPDSSLGGPNIKLQVIAPGIEQLYWGK
jgi:hypothetical protein